MALRVRVADAALRVGLERVRQVCLGCSGFRGGVGGGFKGVEG
jgi:hypothetical protein